MAFPTRFRWPFNLLLLLAVLASARIGLPYPYDVVRLALETPFAD